MSAIGNTVRSLASAGFVVRYTLTGPNAVCAGPDEDPRIPDYVEQVVLWAERARAIYTAPPFCFPDPADGKKISIRIKQFPALGRASRKREITLHNRLEADVLALTVAHEVFHVIQYQYPRNSGRWREAVIEGGAVYAEQFVTNRRYDALGKPGEGLRSFRRVIREPHRPMTLASYDCALFWGYIGRQAADGSRARKSGPSLYRSVMERCSSQGYTAASLRRALGTKVGGNDLYRFRYDGARPDATLIRADTLIGNFAMAGCLADNGFASFDRRFALLTEPAAGDPWPLATVATDHAAGRATSFKTLKCDACLRMQDTVGDFGSRFYGVDLAPSVDTVRICLAAECGDRGLLMQVGLVDDKGRLTDIVRTDRSSFVRTVSLSQQGARIERLFLVVTGVADSADFQLSVAAVPPQPDVMLTRWDSPPGRELEAAAVNGARTWTSPDLNPVGGHWPAGAPTAGTLQQIDATLRNRGGADAIGTRLKLHYQWANGLPQASKWLPFRTPGSQPATLAMERLQAASTRRISTHVIWPEKGGGRHLFLLATAICGNDTNLGNKSAITRLTCQ